MHESTPLKPTLRKGLSPNVDQLPTASPNLRDAIGGAGGGFTDLNDKNAERWATLPACDRALADATPRHPLRAGASSSVKGPERVKLTVTGDRLADPSKG